MLAHHFDNPLAPSGLFAAARSALKADPCTVLPDFAALPAGLTTAIGGVTTGAAHAMRAQGRLPGLRSAR